MAWLIDFITERPIMFARYVCYIALAVAASVGIMLRKIRAKKERQTKQKRL